MKLDKLFFKKHLVSRLEKISNKINFSLMRKSKESLSKYKKSLSFINKISKSEKYQSVIEKFSQFKREELNQKKLKSNDKKKKNISFIKKLSDSKKLQNIFHNLLIYKNPKLNNKKKELIKTLNRIRNHTVKISLLSKIKDFKLFNIKSIQTTQKDSKKIRKYDQKIGIIFYSDHNLIFLSLIINLNNKIKITGVTEIPIPGNVIGDTLVEDSKELANIALDSINLLELNTCPLLVVISSSFFNIHTFKASDLKQISQSDSKVQSKSPYLSANTLIDFLRMSDSKISSSFIRTIYSKRDFISGWTNTLEMINLPIIGLVPAAPHIFDSITEKIVEEITVLIDIESSVTTLLIGSKLSKLTSHKLPFGSSLYISKNMKDSSKEYFKRVLNSAKLIMNENKEKLPLEIFVMGSGLDKLITKDTKLPKGFKSISELNLSDFSYYPKNMDIHELVSPSIDSSIYSLTSILSSCV